MTYQLNPEQLEDVSKLSDSKRYSYFLSKVVEHQQLWALKTSEGFIMFGGEEKKEIIPLWPHPQFAKAVNSDEWKSCRPYEINLNDFFLKWLPGLARDRRMIGIFPTPEGKGIIVDPKALEFDLKGEIKKFRHRERSSS